MNKLYKALGLLLVSVFFFQCQKDLSYIGRPDLGGNIPAPDPIKAALQGNVVDENGLPASGVTITAGNQTTMTNATGYFRFNDASLDKNTSLVTATKAGYFKGYRVFAATSGTNQVFIKLLKRDLAGTITSSAGGSASLPGGAKISLPANGVVVAASGNAYSGTIKVFAAYINPRASDIDETVPGSFVADDKNSKRVILSSYGMLAVELESAAGEKLQIKQGFVASLTTPIPLSVLPSAPANIALWFVDEQTGFWKEEGFATKQGYNYVGDVKHFSFWNCDQPFDAATLSLTLHNAVGLPLVNVHVKITVVDSSATAASGYTDSIGQVKGFVPANKNLLLEVMDPCNNAVYSKNIPAIKESADLGIVTVPNSTPSITILKGTILDCGGMPVKNGYTIIYCNNIVRYAATNANGEFATSFVTCSGASTTASIIGIDETALQESVVATVNIAGPVTNAGNITACGGSAVQFLKYTVDGTSVNISTAPTDSLVATTYPIGTGETETYIYGYANNGNLNSTITFSVHNVSAAGKYPMFVLYPNGYNPITLIRPFDVTFTSIATAAGQFYEGSFTGQFTADSTGTAIHNISSTFRIRRNF